ncbi:MAG: hypothetical protein B0D96_00535 [Candidatus Sedimenticola endophacoides]|uniref:FHA domain-containing protein n=1 Tax=Candidatus Sedimenticola endophacoides TaxID=2548426 RepID=A0A657PTR2_9GAMM|nr:MAG: hypothetical protein B0D94_12105 [Candidatus Sedimenticola endophacoides]OQX33505.1 MAG: hypothetical protein B0D84_04520 [Candidatus Sedimenticola endophacoides]OQX38236.1 MAG: hypothetical protein B0D96_00535 [Candidatus Sedimenticola endophacoides]OQX38661.1 MAG: hypothetical protein B0D89_12295 [Candidatus Sedimenticola endophacoides]OQX45288.1 MAG: hypothetical protein B0D85_05835 [Candidatus Sedimenticola endophacoides]
MIKITLCRNKDPIDRYEIDAPTISIGRLDSNDIQLDDTGVSKVHAQIKRLGGGYVLEDCLSTNGTFLDDQRVTATSLENGSVINILNYSLLCEIPDDPQAHESTFVYLEADPPPKE